MAAEASSENPSRRAPEGAKMLEEMACKPNEVPWRWRSRRHFRRDDIEPKVQVFSKGAL